MSGVIDTLQVVFKADTGELESRLSHISAKLISMDGIAGAASASIAALGAALTQGLGGAGDSAYRAGAAAGSAFAAGILSAQAAVARAASVLSAAAASAFNVNTGGSSVNVSGFDKADMSAATGSAGSALSGMQNIVVPINLDGVKLGEACIKSIEMVNGITGRSRLSV